MKLQACDEARTAGLRVLLRIGEGQEQELGRQARCGDEAAAWVSGVASPASVVLERCVAIRSGACVREPARSCWGQVG
jgi:hypothetical protein